MGKNLDMIHQLITAHELAQKLHEETVVFFIGKAIVEASRTTGITVEERNGSFVVNSG